MGVLRRNESGPLNDVWILDAAQKQWREITMAGPKPSARRWAASGIVEGKLVVQGGEQFTSFRWVHVLSLPGYDGSTKPLGDAWACDIVAGVTRPLPKWLLSPLMAIFWTIVPNSPILMQSCMLCILLCVVGGLA